MQSEDVDDGGDLLPGSEAIGEGSNGYDDDDDEEEGLEGGAAAAAAAVALARRKRSAGTASSASSASKIKRKSSRGVGGGRSGSSSSGRTRPVVKLLVTSAARSYAEPWRRRPQSSGAGTGFLVRLSSKGDASATTAAPTSTGGSSGVDEGIGSLRIVTNAHVVRSASTVRARASFGPVVVSCAVEWLSLPLDLALLKIVDEEEFLRGWGVPGNVPTLNTSTLTSGGISGGSVEGAGENGGDDNKTGSAPSQNQTIQHLTLSTDLPALDENVTCVGFPQGGTQISVTRGVVSRIDVDSHSVLRIQIDAAINSGNSGGPVFDERGDVVGVASSVLRGAGNIGYIVPGKIVDMFLGMCRDGLEADAEQRHSGLGTLVEGGGRDAVEVGPKHVLGIPNLGFYGTQALESKALRRNLGLKLEDLSAGVRIAGMNHHFSSPPDDDENCLRSNDVVLKINGDTVGMDGTVRLSPSRPDERINFRSLVTCRRVGSKVTMDLLREKERKLLELTLTTGRYLVPKYDEFDASPLYVVCGGCVFCPLSMPLINEKMSKRKNPMAGFSAYYHQQSQNHDQVLVLSKVLADEVNVGYHGYGNMVLTDVNGQKPSNIQELVQLIVRESKEDSISFHCHVVGLEDAEFVICMDMQEVCTAEPRIMSRHMIASWCSADALSKDLREEVERSVPEEAERNACWSTMAALRGAVNKGKDEK